MRNIKNINTLQLTGLSFVILLFLISCSEFVGKSRTIRYPHNSASPEFLPIIYPEALSKLTKDQFLHPSTDTIQSFFYLQENSPGVCVQFDPISILEDADSNLEFSDYQSRITWTLNDLNIFVEKEVNVENFLGVHGEYETNLETGESKIIKPLNGVGPYNMCVPIQMDQIREKNEVEFTITSTLGINHRYTWSFEIISN